MHAVCQQRDSSQEINVAVSHDSASYRREMYSPHGRRPDDFSARHVGPADVFYSHPTSISVKTFFCKDLTCLDVKLKISIFLIFLVLPFKKVLDIILNFCLLFYQIQEFQFYNFCTLKKSNRYNVRIIYQLRHNDNFIPDFIFNAFFIVKILKNNRDINSVCLGDPKDQEDIHLHYQHSLVKLDGLRVSPNLEVIS